MVTTPGFSFPMASISLTVPTGNSGPTVSTVGPEPNLATQSNAASESYGSLRTAGFIVNAADASNSV